MHILLITEYYRPDGGPAAPLFTMLSEELVKRGHQVTVIAPVPHYPSGTVPPDYQKIRKKRTVENGVDVIRVGLPSVNRSRLPARLLQFLLYQLQAVWFGWSLQYDVVIAHSPALEVWLPLKVLGALRSKPIVYSVHDVYPDVGIKLGIFRHPLIIRLVTALEKSCLNSATQVRILSKSFLPKLVALGVPEKKITLIYDWVETDQIKPLPRENDFGREFGLINNFIVLYAGNLGFVQGLDKVLEAANLLKDDPQIRFLLVGDGGRRAELVEIARQQNLKNVLFLPYQPRDRMPQVLATCDVALVSLSKGTGFGALPSKTFSILASGRPLIACVDEGSDTWNLVERAQAGLPIPPEDPFELQKALRKLKQDPLLCGQLGQNGRDYVTRFHSPDYAAQAFEDLLNRAVEQVNTPLQRKMAN